MKPNPLLSIAVTCACLGAVAPAVYADDAATAITIYSSAQPGGISPEFYRPVPGQGVPNAMAVPGYALVRDERQMNVDKNMGNTVTPITGTLLSATDGIVLRGNDGSIYSLPAYTSVRFPDLPGGLNTRPTLVWDVSSPAGGSQKTRVTYQTGGITWWADYNLIFNEGADANSGLLDLSAWVSIINQSGATYSNARLKLIAGDVNRVQPEMDTGMRREVLEKAAVAAPNVEGFTQKDFFEFHLYTLGRTTTLPNNSTKQI